MTAHMPLARVFRALGWAAMRADETVSYVTWCALGSLDPEGSGRLARREAVALLVSWRAVDRRSARRILQHGERLGYWERVGDWVHVTGSAHLRLRLQVGWEPAPYLIPLERMDSVAAMKAALYASVHELPGHDGRFRQAPLSRAMKEILTGVPRTTQRRYDRYATNLVETCFARINFARGTRLIPEIPGIFVGHTGQFWKRLPDRRIPIGQLALTRSAARHSLRKARDRSAMVGLDSTLCDISRGENAGPSSTIARRYYSGRTYLEARRRFTRDVLRQPHEHAILAWGCPGQTHYAYLMPNLETDSPRGFQSRSPPAGRSAPNDVRPCANLHTCAG